MVRMAQRPGARKEKLANRLHYRITIKGTVQGVGFRPFVYNQALAHGLTGSVLNAGRGVVIEAEGEAEAVEGFTRVMRDEPPRLAWIDSFTAEELPLEGYTSFEIIVSAGGDDIEALVPPDVGLCPDCARETFDPADRHFGYPFTNCTNCGPRFTMVRDLPYDRPKTSMAVFPMCRDCAREYRDPLDRRFHAQPVACPVCGPSVEFNDAEGRAVEGEWRSLCWDALGQGRILALKSLGGFHLVCDARHVKALNTLRRRKGRNAKPFAVMCRDLEVVKRYCLVDEAEAELLCSPQAPIVVLRQRPDCDLPVELAPGLKSLGVMLPYTPLHHLLFGGQFDILVMTSGNYSELPLAKENADALSELAGIADFYLWHNREILNRADDSLAAVVDGDVLLYRRSRGYVPSPVKVPFEADRVVLGIGGEMKNTFCLLKQDKAFVSQHVGELDSVEGEDNLFSSLVGFQRLLGIEAEVVGYDLHPDYRSSRLAGKVPALGRYPVQHHHAHLVSCLADNGVEERAIGVILDGTGYGGDGTLWGFEVLTGDYTTFKREYHLGYVPLPGGEQAVRNPWRTAVSYLHTYLGAEAGAREAERLFGDTGPELAIVQRLLERDFNCPPSSGCGRLFDAVSALLGVCRRSGYEGQAAIELGELVLDPDEGAAVGAYPFAIDDQVISAAGIVRGVLEDLDNAESREIIATRFHNTIVQIILECVRRVSGVTGLRTVALSGGSWQNRYLFASAKKVLPEAGYRLLYHRNVPANDGGLCLGQAVIAYRRWREECV